ncbi:pyruvate kinase [Halothiobacillus diazotrophicus]|uniref:Pyruvate kinase n=1 Tax=Halothiobacillus diazotrophicus TaxID=1860122 RepID=A0A191ZH64_9GAMM|nr:pyruvate kinase [Halothiobacillus diazotrophicus]ANJ67193.1 pyruvate kinase [Halothiobacillus diazotrophicus]
MHPSNTPGYLSSTRRTKIVATLGPASDNPQVIEELVRAGVDVVRLNFSHGKAADHQNRADMVREAARKHGRFVSILGDLQGPKIRIDRFKTGKVELADGAMFTLDADMDRDAGDEQAVGITYKALVTDSKPGDILLLDDGRIVLQVESVVGNKIQTKVVVGGELSNNKGINRQGGGLSAPAITEKDRDDIKTAAQIGVDYIAVSFPRTGEDIHEARRLLQEAGCTAHIVAKIERAEAIDSIRDIIQASDAIMIARGDLGVEIGDAELPAVQKAFIRMARDMNRPVITATQMMETMITNPIPTRAEVFDVANAVLDGTDAVMLSAETAAGKHPVRVVETMARICHRAEYQIEAKRGQPPLDIPFERIDQAIAYSAIYTANHLSVGAIVALTESGATPLWMSRVNTDIPIYAFTRSEVAARRVALYRGVQAVHFPYSSTDHAEVNRLVIEALIQMERLDEGDLVIITKGDLMGEMGGTNAMKIVRVGDIINAD